MDKLVSKAIIYIAYHKIVGTPAPELSAVERCPCATVKKLSGLRH